MTLSFLAQPVSAIAFGAFILCAETCLHFESIIRPTSWLDLPWYDWAAAGMLLHAGLRQRVNRIHGQNYLAAAWGFMTSLLAGAVVAHAEELSALGTSDEWIPPKVFFGTLVSLLAVATSALVITVRQRPSV